MKWTNRGHQLDHLGEQYLKVKNLYIYGVDEKAKDAYRLLQWIGVAEEFNISFVLDITVLNRGASKTYCGKPVVSFQAELCNAFRMNPEECAIALPWIAQTAERAMLEELGAANIFYLLPSQNRRDNFIQNFVCIWLMYKHGKLMSHWTNFLTTSKCNLNCKNCLNFNESIISHCDVTFEAFKEHLDTVFSKFDYLYSLHLSGGETLLVKELPRFIRYIHENYRERIFKFFIITNGTIIPNEETLTAVKSMNGSFLVDDYSNSIQISKVEAIKSVCEACGVGCAANKADFWFDLDVEGTDYNGCTVEELERLKDSCNSYLQEMAEGKIFACCYEEYANRVGIGTPDPSDSIDIADTSKMEILEFRQGYTYRGYVELCKHCRGIGDNAKKTAVAIQIPQAVDETLVKAQQQMTNTKPLVSICVPVYNTEKYLVRCIKSLIGQTYHRIEIVLIDDGSTDQSGLICDEYATLDQRIVVVHKPNGGEASARNAGLRAAGGEYIMFIDSDDEYFSNAVQVMVDEISKGNADLVVGGYLERNGDEERFATGHIRNYTSQEIARSYLTSKCGYAMPYIATTVNAKLFRRELIFGNHISFDERFVIGNDSVFMCEYLRYAKTIRDIFSPIYIYYKYHTDERVQGMSWYYPDSFFMFAYVADRMIKIIEPDEAELKLLVIKQYKDFFYAAVNAVTDIGRFQNGLSPYFSSFCNEIDFLQIGARLDLVGHSIAKEEGALPFKLLSYLLIKRRFNELCMLLQALSKMRNTIPFNGERVRQMIRLDDMNSALEKTSTVLGHGSSLDSNFASVDELLVEQINELVTTVVDSQMQIDTYRKKIGLMEVTCTEAEEGRVQAEERAYKAGERAHKAEERAIEAENRACKTEEKVSYYQAIAEEYANSTSWRVTEPLRKIMRCLRALKQK